MDAFVELQSKGLAELTLLNGVGVEKFGPTCF